MGNKKVYVAFMSDRHHDPLIKLFYNQSDACKCVTNFMHDAVADKSLLQFNSVPGYIKHISYIESDHAYVIESDVIESDVIESDVIGDDVIGDDVIGDDVIGDDVIGDDVIGNEINMNSDFDCSLANKIKGSKYVINEETMSNDEDVLKEKVLEILFDKLESAYDHGNIYNGGIEGGENAANAIIELFKRKAEK